MTTKQPARRFALAGGASRTLSIKSFFR